MFQKFVVVTLFCGFLMLVTTAQNCDELGILLYEDLHCNPVKPEGNKCPTHFECDDFQMDKNSCLFQSKKVKVGELLDQNVTYAACAVGCHCVNEPRPTQSNSEGWASVLCAVLDCPEWLGMPLGPECKRTFKLNACCSLGQICPPFDNVTKCIVNGTEYVEGERMSIESCWNCVCQKGWTGELKEPFCSRKTCATQVMDADKLAKYCAPVYLNVDPQEKDLCCPYYWACPSRDDKIIQIAGTTSTDLTCKWGDQNVKKGEGLNSNFTHYSGEVIKVTCECVVPPLLTCKRSIITVNV